MQYNDDGLWKYVNVKVADTLPIGTIIPFAGSTLPANYMECDGSAISRVEYASLFSAIGTTYGAGDGSTTFNLPNLKGRVPVGEGSNDGGTHYFYLGSTGGEYEHTLTVDEMPSHNHTLGVKLSGTQYLSGNHGVYGTAGTDDAIIKNKGGGAPHNNLQPFMVIRYVIKVLDAQAGGIRSETLPVGSEVDYVGNVSDIPTGWEQITDPNVYSEEEVKTDKVWIDGKPIYRIVFSGRGGDDTDMGIISNLDRVTSFNGFIYSVYGQWWSIPNYFYANGNSNYWTSVYFNNNGNVHLATGSYYDSNSSYYVIIEYTKTTDEGGNS